MFVADFTQDNFLIVTDSYHDGIYQFDLDSKSIWRVPFSHQGHEISLTYDPTYLKVYWTSFDEVVIKKATLTGIGDGTSIKLRERMYCTHVLCRQMRLCDGDVFSPILLS